MFNTLMAHVSVGIYCESTSQAGQSFPMLYDYSLFLDFGVLCSHYLINLQLFCLVSINPEIICTSFDIDYICFIVRKVHQLAPKNVLVFNKYYLSTNISGLFTSLLPAINSNRFDKSIVFGAYERKKIVTKLLQVGDNQIG